jgi:Uri superfamily endonuclease
MNDMPVTPGTYALHLCLSLSALLSVGRLGEFIFPVGEYVYLGSAFGPGGLRARLGRHLRGDGNPHWHIDTLRAKARVRSYHFVEQADGESYLGPVPLECQWSQALARANQAHVLVPGFGASDCRAGCPAHLVAFRGEEQPSFTYWLADFLSHHPFNHRLTSQLMR